MSTIRWDVLTIGHLSRNKFWGESDESSYRDALCTCTLLRTGEQTIIVDPSLPPEEMARTLDRRAGLTVEDVDTVFLTHFHGDHRSGIEAFPDSAWLMARREISARDRELPPDSADRRTLERLRPVHGDLAPGLELMATPGHTPGHHSLVFDSEGMRVVVAGDAAMTRDFFRARDYYFNTADPEAAVESIEKIAQIADIIVPGHDNYFVSRR